MIRKTDLASGILVASVMGYIGYSQMVSHAQDASQLMNTNIQMGAVVVPDTTEACGSEPGFARLLCLIDLLKADASPELLADLEVPYSVTEAQKWSNLPAGGYRDRPGATLGAFSAEQLGLVKAILQEAAGLSQHEGYDEMEEVLNADDYIVTVTTDQAGYSSSNFYFGLLGTPAATGIWELYYGGHHFAFANTYQDGVLAGATPSFRGVEPFTPFSMNGRENAPMVQEQQTLAAMLGALSADQQAKARLADSYRDIVAGPQNDAAIPAVQEGLSVAELDAAQQALVLAAIATYVGDINSGDAAAITAKYAAELPQTVIGFSGTPQLDTEDDYVRIDGPSIWLELSMQSNKSTGVAGNHPHSVWRDKTADYGGNR